MGEGAKGIDRRGLLRAGLVAGGTAAAAGVSAASPSADAASASTPPSVSLALARHWPWGLAVDKRKPFYLSPDPRGGMHKVREGIEAPLLLVPFTVLVNIGNPAAVNWPFHVHVEATGRGLAAKAVGLSIRFPQEPPHQVTTREWLGIFPVRREPGNLQLTATLREGKGHPAADRSQARVSQADASTLAVAGDFGQAATTSTLSSAEQASIVGSVAGESEIPFDTAGLINTIERANADTKAKLASLNAKGSAISIVDMFEMQMVMNRLSQLNETSSATIAATNSAITSMSRNTKG